MSSIRIKKKKQLKEHTKFENSEFNFLTSGITTKLTD